ncbi:hypothetical protein SORBI_3009G082400 [Sorghum bicolor]|uniref:Uncharacterized protein n=1 Tax=Sorghum bicolor TaxID=4558 RepID=A0A1B6P794_SORBI|nr:hypothetical protein SORBI_3009G082400 [Sorghum bicolor]
MYTPNNKEVKFLVFFSSSPFNLAQESGTLRLRSIQLNSHAPVPLSQGHRFNRRPVHVGRWMSARAAARGTPLRPLNQGRPSRPPTPVLPATQAPSTATARRPPACPGRRRPTSQTPRPPTAFPCGNPPPWTHPPALHAPCNVRSAPCPTPAWTSTRRQVLRRCTPNLAQVTILAEQVGIGLE